MTRAQRLKAQASATAACLLGRIGMDVIVTIGDREIQSTLLKMPMEHRKGHWIAVVAGVEGECDCGRIRPGKLARVPKCERSGKSQFCNGADVREVIVRQAWNAPKDAPGVRAFWCAGCRSLNHGGYRFPRRLRPETVQSKGRVS